MRLTALILPVVIAAATLSPARADDTLGLRPGIAPNDNGADGIDTTAPAAKKAAPDDDPYAALGIRAGSFILYPSLTVSSGYTTNAAAAAGGTASPFGTVTPDLVIQSDWARNALTIKLDGSYEKFFDGATADVPTASADATGRIDFAPDWTADLDAGYLYDQQSISDPSYPAGADHPPGVNEFTTSATLNGRFGRSTFAIEGSADRTLYDNATSGGVPVDQGDRDNTDYSARLRVGYDATASLSPFVEGVVSRRTYDRPVDNHGVARAGTEIDGRVGVAFNGDGPLQGEASVGTATETFDDASLATLSAMTADGSLTWTPGKLTTVAFDATTTLKPATDPASSGSVDYFGSVDVTYAWRRNVDLDGIASIEDERFQGTGETDRTYQLGASATWKMNRTAQLIASYTHEWLDSTEAADNYASDTVQMELRLQR